MDSNNTMNVCKCPHHKVTGIAAVLIGVVILLGNLGWLGWNVVNIVWPILLIIGASTKVGSCKCCPH